MSPSYTVWCFQCKAMLCQSDQEEGWPYWRLRYKDVSVPVCWECWRKEPYNQDHSGNPSHWSNRDFE